MIETKNQYNSERLRDRYWEKYHPNGRIWYKGNFINGERDGYWEWYYSNGKLAYTGNYLNGKYDGYWEWYHYDGNLRESIFYDNN